MLMKILEAPFGSDLYRAAVDLRYEILRKPLRLDYTKEQLAEEATDVHVVAVEEGKVIAAILLRKESETVLKMRQFAVAKDRQGEGIGSEMVTYCEDYALEHGFETIVLHARETAVRFYEQLEYEKVGERFTEVTIPHFKMLKHLVD
jgi:N-acetylglutamate synthase-like GNAT family acetyltransferase